MSDQTLRHCGTVLRCGCGNRLTPARTAQLLEDKAIRCGQCKTLIDAKAFEVAV
jgi:hypothetical protein